MLKQYLRTPGPTDVPERIIRSMSRPMISHRGKKFEEIFESASCKIKYVFQTNNDVLIFPASGTGVMEASIVNLFSPGDKILSFSNGVFGDRFATIAERFGAVVERITVDWGKPINPELVSARLEKDTNHDIKGVLFTHNETSTGVLNDIKMLRKAVGDHPAIVIVDAVSSMGAVDIKTDEWGLDVVVTGSQKALMLPPGLGFVSLSKQAWEYVKNSKMPKYYWDFIAAKNSLLKNQTPYTPAVSLIYGLEEALKMIKEEGLKNVFKRHRKLSKALRSGLKNLNLKLFVENDMWASPTVTAVDISRIDIDIRQMLYKYFNISVAGGQQKLKDKIIRIGHMGYIDSLDIISYLAALELILNEGKLCGKGVAAAEKVFKIKGEIL